MISNIATDPNTGRQVIVANFESFRKKLEDNIDKACNEFLNEPDWNKNFEIYDALNRTAYLCPFAVAAVRRKLKTKNPEIEILALHLLEGMIKNVPSSHGAVSQPSFMRYLVKVAMDTRKQGMMKSIGQKFKKETTVNKAHVRAQTIDKALLIIQMLKNAYENSNTYPIFLDTYKQLIKEGVRFPVLTKDEDATVFAPMYSHKYENYGKNAKKDQPSAMGSVGQIGNPVPTNHANIDRSLPMIRPVKLLEEAIYDEDLKTAQENAALFFEMVNSSQPGSNLAGDSLIQQLYETVTAWQAKVVVKVSEATHEKVLDQAFQINDMMNNLIEDYRGLLNGTKRRYEEGIDINKLSNKNKDNDDDDDDNSDDDTNDNQNNNQNNSDEKDDDSSQSNKNKNGNKGKNRDSLILPPPPQDEGGHTHHSRKHSRGLSKTLNKQKSKDVPKDDTDLLDMFGNNNNNNNVVKSDEIIRKKPNLQPEQSAMNIFDIMGSVSTMVNNKPLIDVINESDPNLNNNNTKIGEASLTASTANNTSSNNSVNPNNNGTMASANNNGFDSLGDPFSGGSTNNTSANQASNAIPPPTESDPLGDMMNPFDVLGGSNKNLASNANNNNNNNNNNNSVTNNQNNNNASNPFGMTNDPFASLGAPSMPQSMNGNGNVNANANANTTTNVPKKNDDFMGGGDNPFALFDSGNAASTSNNNNNSKNNNNNNSSNNDFLGGDNPFAGLG